MAIMIPYDYYDNQTREMLNNLLTNEDKIYIETINETTEKFLFKRWNTIINSLQPSHYNQYYSQTTSQERNNWFKKYLDYPTKDIRHMPEEL